MSKNHIGVSTFQTFLGVKMPQGVTTTFCGQNNIKNEFSALKLLRVKIVSKIQQLLKIAILRGIFNIFGVKNAPQGAN